MSELSSRTKRLQQYLRELLDQAEFAKADAERLGDRIANALLIALHNENHPLFTKLEELKTAIAQLPRNVAAEDAKSAKRDKSAELTEKQRRHRKQMRDERAKINHARLFFLPQPGLSNSIWRRLWPLQLLLHATSGSPSKGSLLAAHLDISFDSMIEAANAGTKLSVQLWSKHQYIQHLIEAVGELDSPDTALTLIGRFLKCGGISVRLSDQQEKLLRRLAVKSGAWVSHAELEKAGVGNPVQATAKLRIKLDKAGLYMQINSQDGSYSLPIDQLEIVS